MPAATPGLEKISKTSKISSAPAGFEPSGSRCPQSVGAQGPPETSAQSPEPAPAARRGAGPGSPRNAPARVPKKPSESLSESRPPSPAAPESKPSPPPTPAERLRGRSKLAHKFIQPRQSQRREQRNPHQSGQHRRRLAQPAKLVDAAMTARPLLNHG